MSERHISDLPVATQLPAIALPWLAIAALWMIALPYRGISHDAVLYSFQTMAHLQPDHFANDIFLRYGSQDRFSFFSSAYALLVDRLGIESAAAWTTFAAQLTLLSLSWLLARRLASKWCALVGVAFATALPTDYSQFGTFHVLETFVSPRMPAEALAIGAILALLNDRRLLSVALLIGSAALHPLMAAPVVVIAALLALPQNKIRHLVIASVGALALLAAGGALTAFDRYRIDPAWDAFLADYAGYLHAANWRVVDWIRLSPAALTLLLGAQWLESPVARRLCAATLAVGLLGIALMIVGADWLRFPLLLQLQGYRWTWPGVLTAVLLLPAIGITMWRGGSHARAALFALAALWIVRSESFGPAVALIAVSFALIAAREAPPRHSRWMLLTSVVLLSGAALYSIAGTLSAVPDAYEQSHAPVTLDRLRSLLADGIVTTLLMLLIIRVARASSMRMTQTTVAIAMLGACATLIPGSFATWSRRELDASLFAAFSAWRQRIPVGAEVAWIDSPESVWLLLERPSYFSIQQTATGVFSRAAALELMKRERQITPFMKLVGLNRELQFIPKERRSAQQPARSLTDVCEAIDARFVVARINVAGVSSVPAPEGVSPGFRALRLYDCDSIG